MGPRQTVANTRATQLDRRQELRPAECRQKRSEPASANVHAAPGPPRPRPDQRSSGPVGGRWPTAKTGFLDAKPTLSRFPADRRGDQDVVGSHRVTTFFSLRLRVRQHFTYRLAAET
jgi:hypothetical protein